MPNTTGGIRTRRNQSSSNGYKTLGSILASDSGNGAGSVRRMYGWYAKNNLQSEFYKIVFDLQYGQYKNSPQWVMGWM